MTDKEIIELQDSLIESLEEQVKIQDEIIKNQEELIKKTEEMAKLKYFDEGYRKALEDIRERING
jgi:phosphoenolpyruvate carboxylase